VGLWSDYRLAAHERRPEPYDVMHGYASRLVAARSDYTARFARYAAFSGGFRSSYASASCSLFGSFRGYRPWSLAASNSWWSPSYAFAYAPGIGCRGYGLGFVARRRPGVFVPTPPVRPTPAPPPSDSSGAGRPAQPRPRTRPDSTDGKGGGERLPPGQTRADLD